MPKKKRHEIAVSVTCNRDITKEHAVRAARDLFKGTEGYLYAIDGTVKLAAFKSIMGRPTPMNDPKIKELLEAAHDCWENSVDPTDIDTHDAGLNRLGRAICAILGKAGNNPNSSN